MPELRSRLDDALARSNGDRASEVWRSPLPGLSFPAPRSPGLATLLAPFSPARGGSRCRGASVAPSGPQEAQGRSLQRQCKVVFVKVDCI